MGDGHLPPSDQTDDALEGTAAHYIASTVLSGLFADPLEWVDRQTPNGVYVTPDMGEHVGKYVNAVQTRDVRLGVTTPAEWFGVEVTADFYAGENIVRCRVDHAAVVGDILYIDDFKYGWRLIEVEDNWQLIAGAIGIIEQHTDKIIRNIVLTIHQPRPYHPEGWSRSITLTRDDIETKFAILKLELNTLATGTLISGPWCRDCPALVVCQTGRASLFNALEASGTTFTDELDGEELGYILDVLKTGSDRLKHALEAYQELAIHRLKSDAPKGKPPGWTLEPSLGDRAFKKGITPEMLAMLKPGASFVTTPKLISPAQAEKLGLDKKYTTVDGPGSLVERPSTGVRLTRHNPAKAGARMFNKGK